STTVSSFLAFNPGLIMLTTDLSTMIDETTDIKNLPEYDENSAVVTALNRLVENKELMVQSSNATRKKLGGYMNERHLARNSCLEIQNLDPTLAVPEKVSSIFTSGEPKRFSAIDVPLEEISTYAAMTHAENLPSTSALSFWQKLPSNKWNYGSSF
ncbi:hypothetical protein L9F63_011227, partial [Diploptera punctata]